MDAFSVVEVKLEEYIHFEIVAREDSLILHKYDNQNAQTTYEIVLHKENQSKYAFSVYRSTNFEEAQIYYIRLKDKLPVFSRYFPNFSLSQLSEMCKHINQHPTQNLAHICAFFGYVDYFRQLQVSPSYTSLDSILNHQDERKKTPLHVAIEKERLNIVQSILLLSPKLDLLDEEENNMVHAAALTNRDIISSVCNSIQSRSVTALPNESSNLTVPDEASRAKEPVTLIKLLNTKNRNNFTPLYLAAKADKPDCVKELLKYGADVNGAAIDEQHPPRREDSFQDLSDNKLISKLNDRDMKNGGTPLHWCKSAEVVEMLVDMDCNLNARNFHGETALHLMITRNNLPCVLTMLSHGADVNAAISGKDGSSPLHLAVKTNDISMVQSIIVFGANVDALNGSGESARHLAATANVSPSKDIILYMLNAVCAKRCAGRKANCNEGCSSEFTFNGIPPENPSFLRNSQLFDTLLIAPIIKAAVGRATQLNNKAKEAPPAGQGGEEEMPAASNGSETRKGKLLSLDGGGIRGLILIQILCHLETLTGRPVYELFDWIAGTSTGGICALLLASGYSAKECRQIYFRLKDKIFVGYRPYCSDTLERFLQRYLGREKRMHELTTPKVMVTATVADRFPPDIKFFRNYDGPNELLEMPYKHDSLPELKTTEEYVWKVARASGAAPTYFSQCDCFLDGGLVSNNPTLDLLTEVQNINRVNKVLQKDLEVMDIGLVVSIGTGAIPIRNLERINFSSLASLSGISSLASNLTTLIKVLVEQASQADGQVVERAQAWCSMIDVPYFRVNPPISEDIQLDESDNAKLVNMMWETLAYIYQHKEDLKDLQTLLTLPL